MRKLGGAAVAAAIIALSAGCSSPTPAPTVTVTAEAEPAPTVTVTVTPPPAESLPAPSASGRLDLKTDEGLCAADAAMSNLELNDAIALVLGYPGDRDLRSFDQDDAIREYKNAAFQRACPARAS